MSRITGCVLLVVLASGIPFFGQNESPALPNSKRVISYLNQSISWYRHFSAEEQLATEPRDVLFVNENRQLADQIIRLSFEFAKAEAQNFVPESVTQNQDQTDPSRTRFQSLQTMAAKADQQVKKLQAELESLKDQLDVAKRKRRESLRAAVAEVKSEVEMAETRRDTLRAMVEFTSSATGKGTDGNTLRAQIEQLERTVPVVGATEAARSPTSEQRSTATTASTATKKEPTGILGLIANLFAASRKSNSLREATQLTDGLAKSGKELRTPLLDALNQAMQQSDQISSQPDSTDPAVLKQQKTQLDGIIAQYKQYSTAVLPLSKQRVLLDEYQSSLADWKEAVREGYEADLRELAIRLAALGAVIISLFVFSELGRRAIFRYARDTKRRYQFLLLRRFVLWFLIVVIVAFAFASQLGALATFAGLLTAGVAVALQNVILSVVGYFLLIGKYGIRVGDRVQIAGVTGEVVEVGLVRLHVMEWASGDSDAHPTGRVAAFSNSVVFQPSGVLKQIPGTNYVWHEITLTLAPESDFRAVEERLLSAVDSVYSEYRESIERQRKQAEKTLGSNAAGSLNPQSRLRLTKSGLEIVIRYPLEFQRASALDDLITRAVLEAIEEPPQLRLVGTGAPNIQQVVPTSER